MTAPALLVVGSVAYDSIQTPLEAREDLLGGSATYFSLASSLLVPTGMVAVVGEDFRPTDRQLLQRRGIDIAGLETVAGKTFRWGGRYDQHLKERESLYTCLNAFADFRPRLPDRYQEAPYLFLANIDPDLQLEVLSQCRGPRWVACDTMNFWIRGKLPSLMQLLPRIDALFLNDSEAFELTGERNLRRAARWIQRQGTPTAVIKKGEHGAIIVSGEEVVIAPAFLLEQAQDPTGAGDTFAGGMAGAIAATGDLSAGGLRQAAAMGTVAASYCVERFGPERLAELTREELVTRFEHYRGLVNIPEAWGERR